MKLIIIGSGDAFGSGGRFQTCLHLSAADGAAILVDCGASSAVALNRAGIDKNGLGALLFTHFHGDHFGGLPFFILESQFISKRTAPLVVAGPRGVEERTRIALETAFPGFWASPRAFRMEFVEVAPGRTGLLGPFSIEALPAVHDEPAGPCQSYRIAEDGKVFAFSGDTGWNESLIPLAAGADLLLTECYSHRMKLATHLDWETLSEKLPLLAAKRILITHQGVEMLAFREPLPVGRAEDGMELTI